MQCEIEIHLLPGMQGRGIGTDALRVSLHYAFATHVFHRVTMTTANDNEAMVGLARRLGSTLEATLREAHWVDGQFITNLGFGLLAREWRVRTATSP